MTTAYFKNAIKRTLKKLIRRERVREWRPAWLPRWVALSKESSVHPHCLEERADLFLGYNGASTEIEVLNWLHATVCLLKPMNILETGAADGLGTIALASACKANGFGTVHSVELDQQLCERLTGKLKKLGLSEFAVIHHSNSLEYLSETNTIFDFAFYDSLCEIRAEEFAIALRRGLMRNMAVFHDTSPFRCKSLPDIPEQVIHEKFRQDLFELSRTPKCNGYFESALSRGLIVIPCGGHTNYQKE